MNAPLNTHTASPVDPATLTIKPTKETYERLQQAHEHFNKALFGGTLPNALITFQRRKGSFGYFAGARFQNDTGQKADEIALNPMHFASRSQKDILGTLVHEMAHQWQRHWGHPGRGRYHNKEWAEKMKAIGLQPSDTGVMRGRQSSHRELLRPATGQKASSSDSTRPAVIADSLELLPVTAEELDAIEAFLMPQILRLLETSASKHDDSKRPQTAAIVLENEGAPS